MLVMVMVAVLSAVASAKAEHVVQLSAETFPTAVKGTDPLFVKFFAPW